MTKFLRYLRFNWTKALVLFLVIVIAYLIFASLFLGFTNFFSLESFSRKNLMAQMGMFLFVGIMQAFIIVPLYIIGYYYLFMGGGLTKFLSGDDSAKNKANVRWDEVIGLENAKKDAWEIVQFLKDRKLLKAIGGANIK